MFDIGYNFINSELWLVKKWLFSWIGPLWFAKGVPIIHRLAGSWLFWPIMCYGVYQISFLILTMLMIASWWKISMHDFMVEHEIQWQLYWLCCWDKAQLSAQCLNEDITLSDAKKFFCQHFITSSMEWHCRWWRWRDDERKVINFLMHFHVVKNAKEISFWLLSDKRTIVCDWRNAKLPSNNL